MSAFMPNFDQLPRRLPIFPLNNVILLPGSELPLRIFEPRYLEMVDDALKGSRLIGMIQTEQNEASLEAEEKPNLFQIGTVGRITSFTETDEGTYNIVLTGALRFQVSTELTTDMAFRCVKPDYTVYEADLNWPEKQTGEINLSPEMFDIIEAYFLKAKIDADMASIKQAATTQLINTLAMSCPFTSLEKQALLEAHDMKKRTSVLFSLMEMANLNSPKPSSLN